MTRCTIAGGLISSSSSFLFAVATAKLTASTEMPVRAPGRLAFTVSFVYVGSAGKSVVCAIIFSILLLRYLNNTKISFTDLVSVNQHYHRERPRFRERYALDSDR